MYRPPCLCTTGWYVERAWRSFTPTSAMLNASAPSRPPGAARAKAGARAHAASAAATPSEKDHLMVHGVIPVLLSRRGGLRRRASRVRWTLPGGSQARSEALEQEWSGRKL